VQSKQSNRFQTLPGNSFRSSFEFETQLIIIEKLSIISAKDIKVILDQLKKKQR